MKKKTAKKTAAKKKAGCPVKSRDAIPHVANSMTAAAATWELSIIEIKRARNSGCTAFVGPKVYRDKLLEWLQENPPEETLTGAGDDSLEDADSEELKRRKLMREVTRLDVAIKADKHKLDVVKEKYIPRDSVKEEWTRLWAIIEDEAKGLMDKAVFPVFVSRVKAKIK
tara:strand:- start:829 stop:1335 length:507 start_codon:yes stop_codon:yes gene_type:complete